MDALTTGFGLVLTWLITTVVLREAIYLVLRVRMTFREVLMLALLMEVATLVLHYGAWFLVGSTIDSPTSAPLWEVAAVVWIASVVAHIMILALRLDVTALNATKVCVLMLVIYIVGGFFLATVFFLIGWLWMAATSRG